MFTLQIYILPKKDCVSVVEMIASPLDEGNVEVEIMLLDWFSEVDWEMAGLEDVSEIWGSDVVDILKFFEVELVEIELSISFMSKIEGSNWLDKIENGAELLELGINSDSLISWGSVVVFSWSSRDPKNE